MAINTDLMTAEELFERSSELGRCELIDGRLVKLLPAGRPHNRTIGRLAQYLNNYVDLHPDYEVMAGDTGIILERNPDRVRAPDVCVYLKERLPPQTLVRGFLEVIPDLIIEVVSPGDTATEVQAKAEEWLRAGARLVLTVNPQTRSVIASHSPDTAHIFHEDETLTLEPVIPGFSMPVNALFS